MQCTFQQQQQQQQQQIGMSDDYAVDPFSLAYTRTGWTTVIFIYVRGTGRKFPSYNLPPSQHVLPPRLLRKV